MSNQSDRNVLRVETRSLRVRLWATLTLGILGFVAYAVTPVAATQLDGAISVIDAGTAFLAIGLARIAAAHDTGVHQTADPRSARHHLTRVAGRDLLH